MGKKKPTKDSSKKLNEPFQPKTLDQRMMTRREAISTAGKAAVGVAIAAAIGVAGYEAYLASRPSGTGTSSSSSSSTSATQGPIALNFMTASHEDFYYDQESYRPLATYQQLNPNVTINPTVVSFFDIEAKMASTFTAGTYAWDVTYVWGGLLSEFLQYFTKLTSLGWSPSEASSDLIPWVQNAIYYKGDYYGYPRMNEVFLLNANKNIMDAKGVPGMPTTYEQLLEYCKMVHDPANGVYAFGAGLQPGYLLPVYLSFLHANGGYLWANDSQQSVTPDSPQSIKAVQDMVDMFKTYMNPGALQWIADVQTSTDFLQGKHVFDLWYPSHNWVVTQANSAVRSVYCDVWPGHSGVVTSGSQVAAEGYSIPTTAKNPQAALDFLRYVGKSENQVQCYITGGWTPNAQAPEPSFFSNFKDTRLVKWPFAYTVKALLTQEQYNCSRYERPAYTEITAAIEAEVSNALDGAKTASQAMSDARTKCDSIVAKEYTKFGGSYYEPWKTVQQPSVQAQFQTLLNQFKGFPNYYTGLIPTTS
jgi:ABC-type glycerol-3-phosphate transport system substrate-binding protein